MIATLRFAIGLVILALIALPAYMITELIFAAASLIIGDGRIELSVGVVEE